MELLIKFPTEKDIVDYYVHIRYGDRPVCNHCGSIKVYQRKNNVKVFDCNDCHNTFSPFAGTIFEKSSTDLRKWMYAIHMFLNGKKGISGLQLQREIGVTYKTAWRMLQQIRLAMGNADNQEFFDTIVEIDETYVGGKPRKSNEHDDNTPKGTGTGAKRGRGTDKTPVVGMVDRNNKKVFARIAMPNGEGKKLTARQLMDILKVVSKQENNNTIMTDEFRGYDPLTKNNFVHLRVDHTKAFSDNNGTHTNNIESFWATLKRGVYGIYHHISIEYMQRYIDEFCFRYNNRDNDMFNLVLKQSVLVG
ncbi:MAG: IS1595 family transposase [Oscillospiraceae bacterium]|nr:IS1595 family transposase [Oscillospiraceae bacterium]